MRRATNNVRFIIDDENNTYYGVSLGYDFTAEHEWGISGMVRKFGLKTDKLGVDGRKIHKNEVFFAEDDEMCVLTSYDPYKWSDKKRPKTLTTKELLAYDIGSLHGELSTAWSGDDFCVATNKKENYKYIKELYEAFEKKNIVIAFISGQIPAFENASLSLLIADKLPKEITDSMYHTDKKADDLIKYEKKIGVTKLKEKNKGGYKEEKYFLACNPKWISYDDPEEREKLKKKWGTKYDCMFWVNYSDDDDNYGWYTAEQIIKWLSTPGLKLKSLNEKEDK